MAKRQKSAAQEIALLARRADREVRMAALADGRKQRAVTFTDRKKAASRNACRGRMAF